MGHIGHWRDMALGPGGRTHLQRLALGAALAAGPRCALSLAAAARRHSVAYLLGYVGCLPSAPIVHLLPVF